MQEDYEESISVTLRTRSSKKPLGMLARNWKHQWLPLCLARQAWRVSMGRPVARLVISSLNLRVFWKPVNPRERVWKNLCRIIMKTILQEKVTIHCIITIWYTNFPMPQAMKIPAAKSTSELNIGKTWKFRRGTWQKSETNQRWSMKQGRRAQKFMLPHWWTSVIWRMPIWRKYKGRVVLRGDIVKDDSGSYAEFTEHGFTCITNDGSRGHGYHIQTARMRRTSSWRSICLYPGQNARCSKIIENSQIGMSRHMDSSTTTQMAKIMVQSGRRSRSSWKKSVRSSFGRTIMGKAIWENPIEVRLGESFQLGMLIRTPSKRNILICVCGWH